MPFSWEIFWSVTFAIPAGWIIVKAIQIIAAKLST